MPWVSRWRLVPRVAMMRKPISASWRIGATTFSLSESFTETNTVPGSGSLLPPPSWLLAKAMA